MKQKDIYKDDVQTLVYKNATVRVYRPDISVEERERRMKLIKQATTLFVKSTMQKK